MKRGTDRTGRDSRVAGARRGAADADGARVVGRLKAGRTAACETLAAST